MVEKENGIVPSIPSVAPVKIKNNDNTVNNLAVNGTASNKAEQLRVLSFQFCEAYYTMLSDHPDDIGTFYGEDSCFVFGDVEETGRENIQRAIVKLGFGDCKSRFYSIKAAPAIGDGKILQVCGDLTLKGQPAPRRFCQTIVLSGIPGAPPNALYVKSNIFQWQDIFPGNGAYYISPPATVPPLENGSTDPLLSTPNKTVITEASLLNGGNVSPTTPEIQLEQEALIGQAPPPGLEKISTNYQALAPQLTNKSSQIPSAAGALAEKLVEQSTQLEAIHVPADVDKLQKPPEPKSWNKVVSGGQQHRVTLQTSNMFPPNKNLPLENQECVTSDTVASKPEDFLPTVEQQLNVQESALKQITPSKFSSNNNDGGGFQPQLPSNAPRKDWQHRIYFNNLPKPGRFVDFKQGQQELMKEILAITDGVEFVGIKPISLRKEYKYAFGFIDFSTDKDLQAVYEASSKKEKDAEKESYHLKVKIPTFEFDGFLSLTADKTSNLIPGGGPGNNAFSGRMGNGQQQHQSFNRGGEQHQQRKMAPPAKG